VDVDGVLCSCHQRSPPFKRTRVQHRREDREYRIESARADCGSPCGEMARSRENHAVPSAIIEDEGPNVITFENARSTANNRVTDNRLVGRHRVKFGSSTDSGLASLSPGLFTKVGLRSRQDGGDDRVRLRAPLVALLERRQRCRVVVVVVVVKVEVVRRTGCSRGDCEHDAWLGGGIRSLEAGVQLRPSQFDRDGA